MAHIRSVPLAPEDRELVAFSTAPLVGAQVSGGFPRDALKALAYVVSTPVLQHEPDLP